MTKKQRHKFYKDAYKNLQKSSRRGYGYGFCEVAADMLYKDLGKYEQTTKKKFPEYFLFEPKLYMLWWFNEDERLVALEFCIAMTES